jgi:hypothetical protein
MQSIRLMLIAVGFLLIAIAEVSGGGPDVVQDPVPVDFFVSPRGKDTWAGKLPEPGEHDGPFAMVNRAREAARALLRRSIDPDPSASSCAPGRITSTRRWSSTPRTPGRGTLPSSTPRRLARRSL